MEHLREHSPTDGSIMPSNPDLNALVFLSQSRHIPDCRDLRDFAGPQPCTKTGGERSNDLL